MAKKTVNQEEVVNEVVVIEPEVITEPENEMELLKQKLVELEGKLNINKESKREQNREKKEALVVRIKNMAVEERMTRQQIVDTLKAEPGMEWIGYYYVQQILRGTGLNIVRANAKKENKTLEDLLAEKKRLDELIAMKQG